MRYRPPAPADLVLSHHEGHLEARSPDDPPGRGVWARWPSPSTRRGASALVRALGDSKSVIDATGGLGVDAWLISLAGRRVTVMERVPVVAALLADALERARALDADAAARMRLIEGDARRVLAALSDADRPDAVYLDPMFPPRRRSSALGSKPMQFLESIAGDDADAGELLGVALRVARRRVVVKRPPHAPPLEHAGGGPPAFAIETKLLRFDVHRPHDARPGAAPNE